MGTVIDLATRRALQQAENTQRAFERIDSTAPCARHPRTYDAGQVVPVRFDGEIQRARIIYPFQRAGEPAYTVVILDPLDETRGIDTWIFESQIVTLEIVK